MEEKFNYNDTQVLKGIAIIVVFLCHLFLRSEPAWAWFDYAWTIDDKPWITAFMKNGKVCVDIFVICTGFGLNESFNRQWRESKGYLLTSIKFVIKHLLKLMLGFWLIYIMFFSIGISIGKVEFQAVYGIGNEGIKAFIIDFLGLRDILYELFHTGTLNVTWWYMSAIIIYYMLFPVFKWIMKRMLFLPFLLCVFINVLAPYSTYRQMSTGVFFFLAAFCLGMLSSEMKLFDKIKGLKIKYSYKCIYSVLFAVSMYIFSYYDRFNGELLYACAIIILAITLVIDKDALLKKANKILEQFGKNSGNIFMFHTFFLNWLGANIYFLKNPILILIFFSFSMLLISTILEFIKERCRFYFLELKLIKMLHLEI